MQTGNFSRFDYGGAKNLKIYGEKNSPFYHLSKIDIPVYYFAGKED